MKAQLIICANTLEVLMVVCGKGRTHDFKLFTQCRLKVHKTLKKYADAGYQGLAKLYANSFTPRKGSKKRPLTKEDKAYNRELAQKRIPIEHVNRRCKIFRIVKETYRGKRTHYHKTWTLICALVNVRYTNSLCP